MVSGSLGISIGSRPDAIPYKNDNNLNNDVNVNNQNSNVIRGDPPPRPLRRGLATASLWTLAELSENRKSPSIEQL